MPWKKAPEKWNERRTSQRLFRTQKKTHKLTSETPNGMDLSCHRSKTHIQRCCRDGGTFALWKTGEEKSPTLRPQTNAAIVKNEGCTF